MSICLACSTFASFGILCMHSIYMCIAMHATQKHKKRRGSNQGAPSDGMQENYSATGSNCSSAGGVRVMTVTSAAAAFSAISAILAASRSAFLASLAAAF